MKNKLTEQTLVVIKPDGVERNLVGEVIARFERVGLKIVGMRMFVPSPELVTGHYLTDPEWRRKAGEKAIANFKAKGLTPPETDPEKYGENVLRSLIAYLTRGPVVALVLEGFHAVAVVRKLVGSTEPLTSDVGTIRGDYMIDSYELSTLEGRSIQNILHASGNVVEAQGEIPLWFGNDALIEYHNIHDTHHEKRRAR